ncbi:hypothetical protein niasHS_002023 [Heterodera schachtii]|uniref:Mannosyltransferase n=1 Tax=Heterodera schachtii TaxID=97005 RepID=A0ABD2K5R0_HETSC
MGKNTKNFSLLLRKGNSRVPMRRLRDGSAAAAGTDVVATTTAASSSTNAAGQSHHNQTEKDVPSASNSEWKRVDKRIIDMDWTMSRSAALKILLSVRLSASLWSIISDCDEVFNYWEPLHLVLFGRGFQTWEYAPDYAIRSWLYVLLYALPAQQLLFLIGTSSKLALFFAIRFVIGSVCLFSELCLYESVCRRAGNAVGRAFLLFTVLSPAMFGASCAFLPSSFSMAFNALAMALWLREKWFLSIFLTAFSALLGWPFAALLGLPIAVQMVLLPARRDNLWTKFAGFSAISGTILLGMLGAVDTHLFGKFVIAPLNIVLYNIFSAHGPTLYGVEPASFYVRNLLLNFNVAVPLALFGLVGLLLIHFLAKYAQIFLPYFMQRFLHGWPLTRGWNRTNNGTGTMPFVLISMAAVLWLVVFFVQPHKEERFLFPVYPHICVLAALGFDLLRRLCQASFSNRYDGIAAAAVPSSSSSSSVRRPAGGATNRRGQQQQQQQFGIGTALCALVAVLFVLFSVSRIAAVRRNYAGLMDTYRALNEHILQRQQLFDYAEMRDPIRLCVGKEWHRFPSSFFLPESAIIVDDDNGTNNSGTAGGKPRRRPAVEMEFVRSEFRGILPAHFADGGGDNGTSTLRHSTAHAPLGRMNDANREEMDRYVPVESCDLLVHLEDGQETELEPNYAKMVIPNTNLVFSGL